MSFSRVDKSITSLPLVLVVTQPGLGGIPTQTSTVAIRNAATTNSYLDWNTGLFATSGWGLKDGPMSSIGNGIYQRNLLLSAAPGLTVGLFFVVEYTTSGVVMGVDQEVYQIVRDNADLAFLRKLATNRLEESGGAPGSVKLYDDDGTTLLMTWNLTDALGGPVVDTPGSPARRGAGV
jgi:hypothetical protein